jgi:formate transporter
MAGRSVADKVVAIVFPVSAFVAAGLEHSVANMYFIPLGILLRDAYPAHAAPHLEQFDWLGLARNRVPVTFGNLVGGAGMVGLVYHLVHRRDSRPAGS